VTGRGRARLPGVGSLRARAGRLARPFRRRAEGRWRKRDDPVRGRGNALREETEYWDHWLSTKGGEWSEDYRDRFDPDAEVTDPALRELLADILHQVGSSPIIPGRSLFASGGPEKTISSRSRSTIA
jgi:hypothetical protein